MAPPRLHIFLLLLETKSILQYFSPDYELDVRPSNMDNANSKEYLDKILAQVVENLKRTAFAPSVQMTDVPREPLLEGIDDEADAILDDLDEDENKDKRFTKRRFDQYIEKEGELSDSEDEDENAANGVRRQPNGTRRRNQVSYRNLDADSGIESGIVTPREESSLPDEDIGMDEKMEDVEDIEAPQEKPTPSPALPATRSESRADVDDVPLERNGSAAPAAEDEKQAAPEPTPAREAPQEDADMDTTMEDASAAEPTTAAAVDTQPAPVDAEPTHQQTPPKSPVVEAPPAPVATPPAEPTEPAEPAQPAGTESAPTESAETAPKVETPAATEEEQKL